MSFSLPVSNLFLIVVPVRWMLLTTLLAITWMTKSINGSPAKKMTKDHEPDNEQKDTRPFEVDVKMRDFYMCPDFKDSYFEFKDLKIKRKSKKTYQAQGTIVMNTEIPDGAVNLRSELSHKKTPNEPAKPMMDNTFPTPCSDIKNKNNIYWQDWNKSFKENWPGRCPIPKGEYTFEGFEMDTDEYKPFLQDGITVLNVTSFIDGHMIVCVMLEFDVKREFD